MGRGGGESYPRGEGGSTGPANYYLIRNPNHRGRRKRAREKIQPFHDVQGSSGGRQGQQKIHAKRKLRRGGDHSAKKGAKAEHPSNNCQVDKNGWEDVQGKREKYYMGVGKGKGLGDSEKVAGVEGNKPRR